MSIAVLLSLIAAALAADGGIVLHDGSLPAAIAAVSRDTGVGSERLDGRRPTELVGDGAVATGGDIAVLPCTGTVRSNDTIRRAVGEATEMWLAMDVTAARARLMVGLEHLACFTDPLEPTMAARGAFLLGALLHAEGDEAGAISAFSGALRFSPELEWDTDIPPDAKPLLERARTERMAAPLAVLHLVPGERGGASLRIDGRAPIGDNNAIQLVAGRHLIQIIHPFPATVLVELPPGGEAWIVVPSLVEDTWAAANNTGKDRARLRGLVEAAEPKLSRTIYLASESGTHRLEVGADEWTLETRSVADKVRRPLLVGGGVTLAAGLSLMAATSARGGGLAREITDDQGAVRPNLDTVSHRLKTQQIARQRKLYWVGAGMATVGLLATSAGAWIAIKNRRLQAGAMVLPGGGGLRLTTVLP